jgi:hypothetical protein
MKTLLIFAAGAFLAGSAFGQGNNISAPVVRRTALPPVNPAAVSEGGIQRGFRVGNPIQMFNPVAPREYGEGRDLVVTRDVGSTLPHDRARAYPIGLRLFTIAF